MAPAYYGRVHCNAGAAEVARSLGIVLHDAAEGGYHVWLTAPQHAQLAADPADYTLAVLARADDAGQTPLSQMTAAQLQAELAYCDWAIAASVPFTPPGLRDADVVRRGAGFGVAPRAPSPVDLFQLRDAVREALRAPPPPAPTAIPTTTATPAP